MVKWTHEKFIAEVAKINSNIEILDHFVKTHDKIKCRCKIHNYIWFTTPKTLLKGVGCPICGREKTNNVLHQRAEKAKENFILSLKEKDIQLIGDYNGYEEHCIFKCLKCGNIWKTSPHSIANNRGCPKCGLESRIKKRSKTNDQFIKEIKIINPNIEILSEYKNNKTKMDINVTAGGILEWLLWRSKNSLKASKAITPTAIKNALPPAIKIGIKISNMTIALKILFNIFFHLSI